MVDKLFVAPLGTNLAALGTDGKWVNLTGVEEIKVENEAETDNGYLYTLKIPSYSTTYTIAFSMDGVAASMNALKLIFGDLATKAQKTDKTLKKLSGEDDGFEPGVNCLF